MVANPCYPSTWEIEAVDQVQGWSQRVTLSQKPK